ncbi:outer membrane protein transport protein [Aquimarina gracilis]|uniref:Outer membrane protein transport protein n=1 Tax=Aquimarina gracilis TaxID=874422 RepID=A0ABU5ZRV0_9FLAO|nr:outer membrane protein transport protein [Aquimarina gracilis]MEB3344689.1 outer membrane protein transport protein [Aquimarina gracilis]
MKKLFLFIGALSMSFLNAQDITDALRYSQQDIIGTARFRGMSGAFGALGGDLSALQINPAGSAVFLSSYGSITLSSTTINNDASYNDDRFLNGFNNSSSSNFNFNQLGAVFIYDHYDEESSGINKLSLGLTYDQTADNADEFFTFGQSRNSIDSYFLTEAQGIPLDLISRRPGETPSELYAFLGETEGYSAQQAFLGHEAFVIEADDLDNPDNTTYFSNIAPGVFDQEYFYESTGLNGKFTLNLGAQINRDFYIGFNLNSHFINYDKVTEFFEGNNNPGSNVNEVLFTNRLSANGAGFSGQIGAIAKVSQMLRLGVSYESPTWYYIEEETIQRIETISDTDGRAVVNPDVVNIFPEYNLRTPESYTGSAAILFGQNGLISLDYTYKDYTAIELSSDFANSFTSVNSDIDNNLQGVSIIRIGSEWRNGNWSFRGGYSYEESPYKNELILGDKNGFSIGAGYSFEQFRFDVAYDYTEQERLERFFPNSGFNNFAFVDTYRDTLTFTLGMVF